jgi:hypothetical protein
MLKQFILVLAVSLIFPLAALAQHNPGHGPSTPLPTGPKPAGCDWYFAQHQMCARLTALSLVGSGESKFEFVLTDLNGQPQDHTPVAVSLFMPKMGHGSSPVTIDSLGLARFRVSKAYFVMPGQWEIRIAIEDNNDHQETAAYSVTINDFAGGGTQNLAARQTYVGQEYYDEHSTGRTCYVQVNGVRPYSEKGQHCYLVDMRVASLAADVPAQELTVSSRVTNYHRPEFPQKRTCALNIDGTSSGDELYGTDTSMIYNQIFAGQHNENGIRYDYFLTLDPVKKQATRARIHVMRLFTEHDIDCVGLELM